MPSLAHRNCWSKQEAALLLEMARRFCNVLPPYSRCSALIGLQRPDLGFRAMGLRGVFVICCNLAYMMSIHVGPTRRCDTVVNVTCASGSACLGGSVLTAGKSPEHHSSETCSLPSSGHGHD